MRFNVRCSALALALTLLPIGAGEVSGQTPDRLQITDSIQRLLHSGSLSGDRDGITRARALAERVLVVFPDDPLLLYYQGEAHYRLATLLFGEDAEAAATNLELAEELLSRSAELRPMAEAHALLSSVIGMQIGANPLKGMIQGPKASRELERALELAPENPRVWLIKGSSAANTPKLFGGGTERALENLERAIQLFEQDDPMPPLPRWGHAEAYAWMGQAHVAMREYGKARDAYATALQVAPEYGWVKYHLLPALERVQRREEDGPPP